VLIAGGEVQFNPPLASTDLYDPATNSFTAGPPMNNARWEAMAALLPNGKVLIAGGFGQPGHVLNKTELYDPDANSFVAGNPMTAGRYDATIVVLPDSQVLIAGGDAGSNPQPGLAPLSSTDLYTQ
jgi:hypothetical protein